MASTTSSTAMELIRPKTGVYIAPHRLRRMQQEAAAADKTGGLSQSEIDDIAFQRDKWESLKRSINALINKVRLRSGVFLFPLGLVNRNSWVGLN